MATKFNTIPLKKTAFNFVDMYFLHPWKKMFFGEVFNWMPKKQIRDLKKKYVLYDPFKAILSLNKVLAEEEGGGFSVDFLDMLHEAQNSTDLSKLDELLAEMYFRLKNI